MQKSVKTEISILMDANINLSEACASTRELNNQTSHTLVLKA